MSFEPKRELVLRWQEFKSLRNTIQNASYKKHKRTDSLDRSSTISSGYFSKFIENGTPFDVYADGDSSYIEEDILLDEVGTPSLLRSLSCFSHENEYCFNMQRDSSVYGTDESDGEEDARNDSTNQSSLYHE